MKRRTCLAIVLAAGEGTRMRSRLPKVMHQVAGRTMLAHVLGALGSSKNTRVAVVIPPNQNSVAVEVERVSPGAQVFVQRERRGTAHAMMAAKAALKRKADDILVLFGDTPLIRPQVLDQLRTAIADGAAVAVLGFRPANPTGYGRLITLRGDLVGIREHR
ncbi:MAG: NTP transferase domain-containing protein, partial [Pseudolabrys sp.]|nr:NTP transferase domain-containing protein [Pseudolabrys sp.]